MADNTGLVSVIYWLCRVIAGSVWSSCPSASISSIDLFMVDCVNGFQKVFSAESRLL